MVCIYCGHATNVTNSRLQKRLNQVWRRRQCSNCNNTFTTHEIVEFGTSIMVRRNTHELAPFIRDNLFISVYEACKHRSGALSNANALTQTIIGLLREHIHEGIVEHVTIIAVTTAVLERFDATAGAVYKAYHPAK
jgi:transcriptional regulator NrdR family protein